MPGVGALGDDVAVAAVDLAAEAAVEADRDLVEVFALDVLAVGKLVVLEVSAADEPGGVGHAEDEARPPALR